MEFVPGNVDELKNAIHLSCGDGISGEADVSEFLTTICSQKTANEAGLYDMTKGPDGQLENCYVCGAVYGFFEEEPNVVLQMQVMSFNDLAYSIYIGAEEYVLPEEWIEKLK